MQNDDDSLLVAFLTRDYRDAEAAFAAWLDAPRVPDPPSLIALLDDRACRRAGYNLELAAGTGLLTSALSTAVEPLLVLLRARLGIDSNGELREWHSDRTFEVARLQQRLAELRAAHAAS